MNIKPNLRHSLSDRNKKSYSGSFNRDKKRLKLFNFTWLLLSLGLLGLFLLIFLTFSKALDVKEINITGLYQTELSDIESLVFDQMKERKLFLKQSNLIFFNKNDLLDKLSAYNFKNIDIKKKFLSRQLSLDLTERLESFLFLENNTYSFLDLNGYLIRQIADCEGQEEEEDQSPCLLFDDNYRKNNFYPLITNVAKNRLSEQVKKLKLDQEYFDFVSQLYNDIDSYGDFGFKTIILDEEFNTVKLRLNNDLELYFNLKDDYLNQVARFFVLKKDLGDKLSQKKYIDLRYGDKIFYY